MKDITSPNATFIHLFKRKRSKRESKASRKKKYSLRKQNIKSVEPEGIDHRKFQLDQLNSFSNSNFNENHEIQRIMSSTKSKK